jgi:ArsR family transcriptional regulator, arsenate/arsenite/antimonite-responsive transcriptional repressor
MDDESAINCMAALSHALRVRIFRFLIARGPGGARAGEICEAIEMAATTASFHFKELHRAGLIRATREGRFIRYAVHIDTVRRLFSFLLDDCCGARPERCGSFITRLSKQLQRFDV